MTDTRSKSRVLIVDDEDGMRRTLRRIMLAKGFDVKVAASGEEAVKVATEYLPDILLVDMKMPGINGVETFRQIKPFCPETLPIFMTAYASSELCQEARDEGAVAVLAKPIDIDDLSRLIAQEITSRPVLIVDDDPAFRNSLSRALQANGFHVFTAESAADALAEFQRHPRCVALLDMKLNGTSGLELLRQIRQTNNRVSAVLMTGFADQQDEMTSGLEVGACCTFVKPFDVDDLVKEIRARA